MENSSIEVLKDSAVGSLPEPKMDFSEFLGWYTKPTSGKQVTSSTTFRKDTKLYAHWAERTVSDWVSADTVPEGAEILDEKWVYIYTEYKETVTKVEEGTYMFGSFPSGYDKDDQYYEWNRSELTASETTYTKREVSKPVLNSYIYWHWAYPTNSETDTVIGSYKNQKLTAANGDVKYATVWEAFESTSSGQYNDNGSYTIKGHSKCCCNWFRIPVYSQTYTDYKKDIRSKAYFKESATEVTEDENISFVRHMVKYRAK